MNESQLRAAVEEWLAGDPHPGDRAELQSVVDSGDIDDLIDRFSGPLQFGTAGLRGPMRAGPNGMNLAVVRRSAAGVARWVLDGGRDSVIVGYDARLRSAEFAHDVAATLAAAGCRVLLADRPWPTPLTAFAVRHLRAGAGIQITASHNPALDNGFKVYDASGSQIVPPDDKTIATKIDAQPAAATIATSPVVPALGDDLIDAYCAMATSVVAAPAGDVRLVYTPLCGVGGAIATRLLTSVGFRDLHLVESQFDPDPTFRGLPFPNPEEPGVLDAAVALARDVEADLVIANDPDADRLAVAVESPLEGWRRLSGDELGVLLGERLLRDHRGVVARTAVSAGALDAVAMRYGSECVVTPTGFKWLSRAADDGRAPLVFAYEEALGYLVDARVRDKDGMTAALVAVASAAEEPVLSTLARIAAIDGVWVTSQWAPRFAGHDAVARLRDAHQRLGGGDPAIVDFAEGRALIRASGTEPKLKCYFHVHARLATATVDAYELVRRQGLADCERMRTQLAARLGLPN